MVSSVGKGTIGGKMSNLFKKELFKVSLSNSQKNRLEDLFNGLDYLFDVIKSEQLDLKDDLSIKLFLLNHKNKIDRLVFSTTKESAYDLLFYIVRQWVSDKPDFPVIHFDEPCHIVNNKLVLPIPKFGSILFCPADLQRISALLMRKNLDFNQFFRIFRDAKNGSYYILLDFFESAQPNPVEKPKVYSDKMLILKKEKLKLGVVSQQEFDLFVKKYKQKENSTRMLSAKGVSGKKSHRLNKKQQKERWLNKPPNSVSSINTTKQENYSENEDRSIDLFKAKNASYKSIQSQDLEDAAELVAAYQDLNTSPAFNMLSEGEGSEIGKFGKPQSKRRNGTYGAASKEADVFSFMRFLR